MSVLVGLLIGLVFGLVILGPIAWWLYRNRDIIPRGSGQNPRPRDEA